MEELYWWYFNQNNSGGYHIENEEVLSSVFIQAPDFDTMCEKARDLFSSYSEYCECCGERWDLPWSHEKGTEEPCMDGRWPLEEIKPNYYNSEGVLHYYNGEVKYYVFGLGFVDFEDLRLT